MSPIEASNQVLNAYSSGLKRILAGEDKASASTVTMDLDGHQVVATVSVERVSAPVMAENERLAKELAEAKEAHASASRERDSIREQLVEEAANADRLRAELAKTAEVVPA